MAEGGFSQKGQQPGRTSATPRTSETNRRVTRLQVQKDMLQTELIKRQKGLDLWKRTERDHGSEIADLKQKMEDMSVLIRTKYEENDRLKQKNQHYVSQVNQLRKILKHSRQRHSYLRNPKVKYDLKLPSIVYKVGEPATDDSINNIGRHSTEFLPLFNRSNYVKEQVKNAKDASIEIDGGVGTSDAVTVSMSSERWVDDKGGTISLPGVDLHITAKSMSYPVLISMSKVNNERERIRMFKSAGLDKCMQTVMQVRLQPQGLHFLRTVYLELKKASSLSFPNGLLCVLHKHVDHFQNTQWQDVTKQCAPTTKKNGSLTLAVSQLSMIEVVRVTSPKFKLGVPPFQFNYDVKNTVCALLNKSTCFFKIHVFYDSAQRSLIAVLSNPRKQRDGWMEDFADSLYLGTQMSVYEICNQENLFFYLDAEVENSGHCLFRLDEVKNLGQIVKLPFKGFRGGTIENKLTVRRRVSKLHDEQEVCCVHLQTRSQTLGQEVATSLYQQVLRDFKGQIARQVDVKYLMSLMREHHVLTEREEAVIRMGPTRQACAESFIEHLINKGPKVFEMLCDLMADTNDYLACELRQALMERQGQMEDVRLGGLSRSFVSSDSSVLLPLRSVAVT